MKPSVPLLLSFNAGYVDTAGFLALQGLFTAHVTGNFVTFGASVVHGTSGGAAKLAALPVFCVAIVLSRLLHYGLARTGLPILRSLLALKCVLLVAAAVLALRFGPFADGNSALALATGMTLVAAMALQNAVHRVHLAGFPPSTLMTGTSTQIMLDIADLIHGLPPDKARDIKARLVPLIAAVAAFAVGCGMAAVCFLFGGMWCFAVPPLVALCAFASATGEVPT
jgi:uncharacterized membrane protein YoaK (UPF0700 family)